MSGHIKAPQAPTPKKLKTLVQECWVTQFELDDAPATTIAMLRQLWAEVKDEAYPDDTPIIEVARVVSRAFSVDTCESAVPEEASEPPKKKLKRAADQSKTGLFQFGFSATTGKCSNGKQNTQSTIFVHHRGLRFTVHIKRWVSFP